MVDTSLLLYIEPAQSPPTEPVIDELTRKMTAVFRKSPAIAFYRGWHTCSCGATSSNSDYETPDGEQINSLCVHYLAYHREEIPQEQLDRVAALTCGEVEPTEMELAPPK